MLPTPWTISTECFTAKKKGLEINIRHFWKHSKCWRSNNSDILPVNVQYMLKQIWSLLLSVTEYMCAYTAVVAAIFCSVLSGDEAQICSEHTHTKVCMRVCADAQTAVWGNNNRGDTRRWEVTSEGYLQHYIIWRVVHTNVSQCIP